MQKLVVILTFCLGFLAFSPAALAGDCSEDPRSCFDGFRGDDSVITEDGEAERTFSFPPVKAGFVLDLKNTDVLPHISIEAVDFSVPYAGDFAVDVGVATSRIFTSLTWEVIPIVKVGPSIWAGYNVKEGDMAFGVGISILDF